MKKIIVGRSSDCDVVIPDDTDNVSRRHMVITVNFMGKMTVSDTSSNGTFINGTRMLKGTSIPVTVNDKIRLGDNWDFDWSLVEDPYKKSRLAMFGSAALLLLAFIGVGIWWHLKEEKTVSDNTVAIKTYTENNPEWNSDSTANVAPVETTIEVGDKNKKTQLPADRKKTEAPKVNKSKKAVSPHSLKESSKKGEQSAGEEMPILN